MLISFKVSKFYPAREFTGTWRTSWHCV